MAKRSKSGPIGSCHGLRTREARLPGKLGAIAPGSVIAKYGRNDRDTWRGAPQTAAAPRLV